MDTESKPFSSPYVHTEAWQFFFPKLFVKLIISLLFKYLYKLINGVRNRINILYVSSACRDVLYKNINQIRIIKFKINFLSQFWSKNSKQVNCFFLQCWSTNYKILSCHIYRLTTFFFLLGNTNGYA